jgi:hypothetical protein
MASEVGSRKDRIFSMGGAFISVNDAIGGCAAMVNRTLVRNFPISGTNAAVCEARGRPLPEHPRLSSRADLQDAFPDGPMLRHIRLDGATVPEEEAARHFCEPFR